MGLIGRVVNWIVSSGRQVPGRQVLVRLGVKEQITADVYPPLNIDSQGLPGDLPYCPAAAGSGRRVAIGWLEQEATQEAGPGEVRLYGRETSGPAIVTLWLQNDGTATLSNDAATLQISPDGTITGNNNSGQFELEARGDFVANGARMTTDGDVQTSDGISLRSHTHMQGNDSAGDTQVPTDPPT